MNNPSLTIAAFALALGIVGPSFGQTPEPTKRRISLSEAIKIALQRQPDLTSARAQAAAADLQHRQAKAAYLPSLTLGLTTNDSYASSSGGGQQSGGNSGLGGNVSSITSTRQADLVLSYNLLDSGQRLATEQSARAGSRAASLTAEDQRQATIANAATSYFELLRQTALVEVQEANVTRSRATLDLTKAQVDQGTQAAKDVYQAQADFETAKVDLLTAQNNQGIAGSQLKQALGLDDDQELEAATPPADEAPLPLPVKALPALVQEAYATRPDMLRAKQNVERERANVRLARANNGVTISVDTNLSAVFLQNTNNSRAIGLTASLPLFNGGSNRAAIRQAEETQRSAEAQLASTRLAARVDVETAYRTLQTAQSAIPAALTAQKAAQINYESASESLREGIGTIVDVITAQTQLVQAQTNYVQALYTRYSAEIALQRALGLADVIAGGAK